MSKEYNFRVLSFRRFVFRVPVHFLVVARVFWFYCLYRFCFLPEGRF